MNKVLAKQVKKIFGVDAVHSKEVERLLEVVSATYDHLDMDREMLNHAMELSSEEMIGLYQKLKWEMAESQKRSAHLDTLFRNIHEVFFSVDMQTGALLQMSVRCEQVYGYSVEDFYQNPKLWLDVVLEEDRHIIDENYPPMLAGRDIQHTHRIRHKDGTIRWLESKITPTLDGDGKLVRIDGITSDVTARKDAEEKLEQRNQELLKINSELDRFVYSASHEMRAPLTSVLGLVNLASTGEEDPDKLMLLKMMQTSVERLDLFIKDIVHYARNSRLEVENERIDFPDLIAESIDQLKYMPEVANIRITTALDGDHEFYSDKKRISVVMNNLLSNAIKYSNPRVANPFIHIHVSQRTDAVALEIRDNGVGIREEYLDKIFNMFYRATMMQSGSGLGLYIVKEIIEKLEGSWGVCSKEGEGSTFHFLIPNLNLKVAV
jgi:PAS domain S-box-containing protein